MKKIMFNDKYGLTEAVLEGRKTMTRRNTDLYNVGEIVAIAQSYATIGKIIYGTIYNNKMFVKAEYMPHHIRILRKWQERLQDISDEDCLKEGMEEHLKGVQYGFPSNIGYCGQYPFGTPREAFAALIDKVSGKGTWESNPLVWGYEFELID